MTRQIFIVEDDENIRELVRMALTSFSYEVTAFDNAEDALAAVYSNIPSMLIFDIMLPGISGLEATKTLKSNIQTANLPIIMLTAKDTEMDKVTGLDYGADDYISKPFSVMELGARVRALFRRIDRNDDDDQSIIVADLSIDNRTREVHLSNKPINLTFKEYELLCMLIQEQDRVVPREELLRTIWGFNFGGETRTLDMHIRTLRQKLGDDADKPRFIKTIRNVGYRFIGGQQ